MFNPVARFCATRSLAALCLNAQAQSIAITLDDAPYVDAGIDSMSPTLHAAMLFVNGVNGGDSPAGQTELATWGAAGHLLANHGHHHALLRVVARGAAPAQSQGQTLRLRHAYAAHGSAGNVTRHMESRRRNG